MRPLFQFVILSVIVSCLLVFTQCRKDRFITDPSAKLGFSTDSLTFDTVFTSVGSITRYFKIYNRFARSMKISGIELQGGSSSPFRINVDGFPEDELTDIELLPKDSLYVFVEVTVDPTSDGLPFVVTDKVIFDVNKNLQEVDLVAWGQNANYISADTITCDDVWTSEKPYVIYHFAYVEEGCRLTIEAGTQVYMHANAGLFVHGTLRVNGKKDEEVVFQGDRLEPFFEDLPGQWQAIHLLRGSGQDTNRIDYAIVKNSFLGMTFGQLLESDTEIEFDAVPTFLFNTIIQNTQQSALFGFFANLYAFNCLIFNTGVNAVQLTLGGAYRFDHCTFVNTGSPYLEHEDPVLYAANYFEGVGSVDLIADFNNCIIYGSLDDEIRLDKKEDAPFDLLFDHCLLKTKANISDTSRYQAIVQNQDPSFADTQEMDFHLMSGSPCINSGFDIFAGQFVYADLDGKTRDAQPDIGCYEF